MPPRRRIITNGPNGCGAAYVWNPRTRICVLRTGAVGRAILEAAAARRNAPPVAAAPCPPGQIRNPRTGRCVDRAGQVGRQVRTDAGNAVTPRQGRRGARPAAPPPPPPSRFNIAAAACPAGTIYNPASGRCVTREGAAGRALIAAASRLARHGQVANPLCAPTDIYHPARKYCVSRSRNPRLVAYYARHPNRYISVHVNAVNRNLAAEAAAVPLPGNAGGRNHPCPPGYVVNPASGRCVIITGPTGRRLATPNDHARLHRDRINAETRHRAVGAALALAAAAVNRPPTSPLRPATPLTRTPTLGNLAGHCSNDSDPVMLTNFKNMNADELRSIVKIGEGAKKHCFLLDTIYQVYATAVRDNRPVKDPLNPGYILTNAELKHIDRMMLARDPSYVPPRRAMMNYRDYELEFRPDGLFYNLRITRRGRMISDLGYVPADVDTRNTGTANTSSGTLLAGLRDLWDTRRLLVSADPLSCCAIHLRKPKTYWNTDKIHKFMAMMLEIHQLRG